MLDEIRDKSTFCGAEPETVSPSVFCRVIEKFVYNKTGHYITKFELSNKHFSPGIIQLDPMQIGTEALFHQAVLVNV